jgi:hypothetical protein
VLEEETTDSPVNVLLGLEELVSSDPLSIDREAQAFVAECMATAGFVYVPEDVKAISSLTSRSDQLPETDTLEYVQLKGYGLSDQLGLELEELEQRGLNNTATTAENNPNFEIRENLSVAEQDAYDRALIGVARRDVDWGKGVPANPETGIEFLPEEWTEMTSAGCATQGYEGVPGFAINRARQRLLEAVESSLQDLEATIEGDARIVEANRQWASCMASEGFSFGGRTEIFSHLERLEADVLASVVREDMSSETTRLANEFATYEVRIAVADWGCGQGSIALRNTVRRAYEIEFVRNNEGVFAAYLDEVGL